LASSNVFLPRLGNPCVLWRCLERLTLIVDIVGVLNGASDAMHVIRTQWISPLRCICLWWWLYGYVRIQMHTLQSITHQTLRWHCNYTVYVSTAIVKTQRLRCVVVLFYFVLCSLCCQFFFLDCPFFDCHFGIL
jgi:hypothetical protein